MHRFLLIIVLCFFFSGCENQNIIYKATEKIDLNPDSTSQINASSLFSNVNYIKLSNAGSRYIGQIEKIIAKNNKIYVLDSEQSIGLYVYNYDGDILYDISNYGRGPGEFITPYDFDVDTVNNQIIIFDASGSKLIYYDAENGEFIKEEKIEFRLSRFKKVEEGYIFFLNNVMTGSPNDSYNIIVTDDNLNVTDEYVPINPNLKNYHYITATNYSRYKDEVFITVPSDYNIYRYSEGEFDVPYKIDFGDNSLPGEFYSSNVKITKRLTFTENAAFNITTFFKSDQFLFFSYKYKRDQNYFILSKNNGQSIHTSSLKLIDDLGVGPLPKWPISLSDNKLIWYQQSSELAKYIKSNTVENPNWSNMNKNSGLVSFEESTKGNENPFLIITEVNTTW